MSEDPLLKRSQLRTGLEPELVTEGVLAFAIGGKRAGLAPAPVQRQHQLPQ
jgi:hypothetical protein